MFNRAPVAFLCTRMSFDFASRVSGPSAPDLAILALLSSCVARFVIQPTALHWTSTLVDIICRIRGERPPSRTIATLFSAAITSIYGYVLGKRLPTIHGQIPQRSTGCSLYFYIVILKEEEDGLESVSVDFSDI